MNKKNVCKHKMIQLKKKYKYRKKSMPKIGDVIKEQTNNLHYNKNERVMCRVLKYNVKITLAKQ